jgi:hypothetical protein
MKLDFCACCGEKENLYQHHLIPNSVEPNDMTVTLCGKCHGKTHGWSKAMTARELTQRALDLKKERGELCGKVPYGYTLADDGIHLLPEPSEQDVIDYMRRLRVEGLSFEAISRRLNNEGIPRKEVDLKPYYFGGNVRRTSWNKGTVHRIIKRNGG